MISAKARAALVGALVLATSVATQVAAEIGSPAPIDRFVIFGDSLSDPGNVFLATGTFEVRPFDPIPDAPYLIGRFHFTNGPTWIEQLSADLDLRRSARPALLRPGFYTNYAFGGARARDEGISPDLATQIGLFLSDFGGSAPPEGLYVLWIGSNDLRDAFEAFAVDMDPGQAGTIIADAIEATAEGIADLYGAHARSFLVLNQPNIGNTPAVRAAGPEAMALGLQLSMQYNDALDAALDSLASLPGIVIARFDVFGGLEALVANPALAGLINVMDSCITSGVIIGAICRRPDKYLFWDFVHPTKRAHGYLGEQAQAVVETSFFIVPRPLGRLARR